MIPLYSIENLVDVYSIISKLILNEDDLKIPHPLIQERKFVLLPLNELNKTFIHPSLNKTNYKMLEDCIDNSNIFLYGNK